MVRPAGTVTASRALAPVVTCGFCGVPFVEDPGQAACQSCPLSRACALMRCPHCGYENPKEPRWLDTLRRWVS
jgi:hypothetical protein